MEAEGSFNAYVRAKIKQVCDPSALRIKQRANLIVLKTEFQVIVFKCRKRFPDWQEKDN